MNKNLRADEGDQTDEKRDLAVTVDFGEVGYWRCCQQ